MSAPPTGAVTRKSRARTLDPGWRAGPQRGLLRRLKLGHLLFLLLLFSGIIPLAILSFKLSGDYQEVLKTQETVLLTHSAQVLANDLSDDMARRTEQLRQLGQGLIAEPTFATLDERLDEAWVQDYLRQFVDYNPEMIGLRIADAVNPESRALSMTQRDINVRVENELAAVLGDVRRGRTEIYRFVVLSEAQEPGAIIGVPVASLDGRAQLVLVALVQVDLQGRVEQTEDVGAEEVFLIDRDGTFLWSGSSRPDTAQIELALQSTDLLLDFTRKLSVTRNYPVQISGRTVPTLARVVPVQETGWGVVAHKPVAAAFQEAQLVFTRVLFASMLLIALAMVFALVAARWLSQPIQRLAETTHEIAAGNFARRVEGPGLGLELVDLADDFNRMSDYVASYVERLQRAAEANRDLFISTIRAFAATIDAKDPYTRGHSERVAAYSRAIARYLGLPKDMQERVWVSAVLHDIGKIGVEDRILKKHARLTPEEFEQMKRHPVIGAEIVAPIAALSKMIPGIRWHHEAWNGSGYPDSLRQEQIPLMARVIAVADTFDAITTNRPYQKAYTAEYALATIEKLAGSKFDPKIVTAFLLACRSGHIDLDRQAEEAAAEEAAAEEAAAKKAAEEAVELPRAVAAGAS